MFPLLGPEHLPVANTHNSIGVVRVVVQSFPFAMKRTNNQMALAIAKTWPLGLCLCSRCASII